MKCRARFCDRRMSREHIVCRGCWSIVAADLREDVAVAWRKSCRWYSARWCRAVRRAVNHADRVIELQRQGYTLADAVKIVAEVRETARVIVDAAKQE